MGIAGRGAWRIAFGVWAGLLPGAGWGGETFDFRDPAPVSYQLDTATNGARLLAPPSWLPARTAAGAGAPVLLGSRVVLQVARPEALPGLLANRSLRLDRTVASNLFVLQAPDALAAAREAQSLAQTPGVEISHPVRRRAVRLHGAFAPKPNDTYFGLQWHLENRHPNTGQLLGPDLNAGSAWPLARGAGVFVAVDDEGIELTHPDLAANCTNRYHYNFDAGTTNGNPAVSDEVHATSVAGLIGAVGDNRRGVSGVAPAAQLVSCVVFDTLGNLVSEETMMDVFQYRSNAIAVQNHSWGNGGGQQLPLSALEDQGIENAVRQGRNGKGVVIVRSAGNSRLEGNDANDDGYAKDPRVIAVGAVRNSGRATSYTTPGASVLLSTFSGDSEVQLTSTRYTNYTGLVTTDRRGSLGYHYDQANPDESDYTLGPDTFSGTSGSAPLAAGVVALTLSANPALAYRDVQQLLVWSCRQRDLADPDLQTNQAGLLVGHSTGFGVPDAGQAVLLARLWKNRPASTRVSVTNNSSLTIPDDGLRVLVSGAGLPAALASLPACPSDGVHPDDPTPQVPLVDVGQALEPLTTNLTGKAALIERGGNFFVEKIAYAAAAGARFVVMFNNTGTDARVSMNGADIQFQPIPAVFIGRTNGLNLRTWLQQASDARARIQLTTASWNLAVTNTLLCEHVLLRARFSHPRRADVRLTLVSPAGTRSVLHHYNDDTSSSLGDWTFATTHHFYESCAGAWKVEASDESPGVTGKLQSLTLTILGVPILDTDRDGLDDDWERQHFGNLDAGPRDDPDRDGLSNMEEQILGTDPLVANAPFELNLSRWDDRWARLSWPTPVAARCQVDAVSPLGLPFLPLTNFPATPPESELVVPYTNGTPAFLRVQLTPP